MSNSGPSAGACPQVADCTALKNASIALAIVATALFLGCGFLAIELLARRRSERGRRGTDEEKARRDSEVRSYRQRNSVLAEEKRALRAERDGLRIERDGLRAERDGLREQVRSERMRTLAGYSGFGHTLSPTIEANEWRVELQTKGVPTPAEKMVDKPVEKTADKAGEEVTPTKGDADSMVDVPL